MSSILYLFTTSTIPHAYRLIDSSHFPLSLSPCSFSSQVRPRNHHHRRLRRNYSTIHPRPSRHHPSPRIRSPPHRSTILRAGEELLERLGGRQAFGVRSGEFRPSSSSFLSTHLDPLESRHTESASSPHLPKDQPLSRPRRRPFLSPLLPKLLTSSLPRRSPSHLEHQQQQRLNRFKLETNLLPRRRLSSSDGFSLLP